MQINELQIQGVTYTRTWKVWVIPSMIYITSHSWVVHKCRTLFILLGFLLLFFLDVLVVNTWKKHGVWFLQISCNIRNSNSCVI
jgi:uncharacterized membrane protein YecN with MAPEG domain